MPLMRTAAALAVVCVVLAAAPAGAAPKPQIADPAGDADGLATVKFHTGQEPPVRVPQANQAYADALSVTWTALRRGRTFTGFRVQAVLAAPPTPPPGQVITYRMFGKIPASESYLGLVWNNGPGADGTHPSRTHLRHNLHPVLVRVDLPEAVVDGSTITWTVPAELIPPAIVSRGSLTDLYFEIRPVLGFQGQETPRAVPGNGRGTSLSVGMLDDGYTTAQFRLA